MLLPITILTRTSASEPPQETTIGLNPDSVARIEAGVDDGTVHIWADGTDKPYVVAGTVEEFIAYVNGWYDEETDNGDEEAPCGPATIATE